MKTLIFNESPKKEKSDTIHVAVLPISTMADIAASTMICGCGFLNSKKNFEPAVRQFELLFPNNHTILTIPESPVFNAPEASRCDCYPAGVCEAGRAAVRK